MTLNLDDFHEILGQLEDADSDQLLEINKLSADLFRLRRSSDGRKKMREMEPGVTRVIFPPATRPKYLARQLGTVVQTRDTRIKVELDNGPTGKFRNGMVICSPASVVVLKNQPTGE